MTSPQYAPETIAITGRGMVTSLGHDVDTCSAAARAGLVRSQPLDYQVDSPDDSVGESAIGYPVPFLTDGFEGEARLLRLAQAGLADLLRQMPEAPRAFARIPCYLSLPNPFRSYTGVPPFIAEEELQEQSEVSREAEQQQPDIVMAQRLVGDAARLSGWQEALYLRFVTISGNAGVAEALARAISDLLEKQVEAAIVGGVDSLLDEDTLIWLEDLGRFKTPNTPAGLQPGEASAFLFLEPVRSAEARKSYVFGCIQAINLAREARTLLSGESSYGIGLTEALEGLLKSDAWKNAQLAWFISDHNGETYRGLEWGNALVRLAAKSQMQKDPVMWYPAASFGDTGAASGAVSLCMATSAFAREYAPARTAVITASSEGSLRAAILLTRYDN